MNRDWDRVRQLIGGWALMAFVFALAVVVAVWLAASVLVGSAVLLHRLLSWAV